MTMIDIDISAALRAELGLDEPEEDWLDSLEVGGKLIVVGFTYERRGPVAIFTRTVDGIERLPSGRVRVDYTTGGGTEFICSAEEFAAWMA